MGGKGRRLWVLKSNSKYVKTIYVSPKKVGLFRTGKTGVHGEGGGIPASLCNFPI